jgi:CheY-like chemotaxis protein
VKAETGAKEERAASPELPEKLLGKHILIVDDIEINRDIMAALLDGSGALLDMAADGQEALAAYCADKPYRYDLILMDMQMPVMDGCTATERIRASGKADAGEVRIVAMTSNVMPEDMARARSAGMNGHLSKPVEIDVLYTKLEEWL